MGPRPPVVGSLRYAAPQLDGAVPAAVPQVQRKRQDVALRRRGPGGGPEAGEVGVVDPGGQGGRPPVELARADPEDRAQFVVRHEGPGVEVPVEQSHPHGRSRPRGDRHRDGLRIAQGQGAACVQLGERGAEAVGGGAQPPSLRLRQTIALPRTGGPHHGHRPEGHVSRLHLHGCGSEGVRQRHGELREAPHGLVGPGQMDRAPGPVRHRHRDVAADRDALPAAEQGGRRSADRAQHERAAVARHQEHAPGMRPGRLDGPDGGADQCVVTLRRRVGAQRSERLCARLRTAGWHNAFSSLLTPAHALFGLPYARAVLSFAF